MRMLAFARRNWKEMLRDPLTLAFGAGFPLVLILLFSLIQKNVPVPLFAPEKLTPGMIVFGQLFLALFSAQLISRDRSSALMMRLLTAPMTAADFILGYVLPLLPLAAAQGVLCLLAAFLLGLAPSWNALMLLIALLITIVLGLRPFDWLVRRITVPPLAKQPAGEPSEPLRQTTEPIPDLQEEVFEQTQPIPTVREDDI